MRRALLLWIIATALLVVGACSPGKARDDRPVVVVSVPPQAYLVEQLAGDLVATEVLIPPGASPATHEPSVREVTALARASLLVQVGHPRFPFEATWSERLLADRPELVVVDSSEGVPVRPDDPHVWVSPAAMRIMAANVHAALVRLLPEHRGALEARLAALLGLIDDLEAELADALGPHAGARILVFHPAWGYLLAEHGIHQLAIEVEGKEPGPAELGRVVAKARSAKVRAVFVQPQFSRRSAEAVAGELDVPVVVLDPLAQDWEANLRRVARTFREALQ